MPFFCSKGFNALFMRRGYFLKLKSLFEYSITYFFYSSDLLVRKECGYELLGNSCRFCTVPIFIPNFVKSLAFRLKVVIKGIVT